MQAPLLSERYPWIDKRTILRGVVGSTVHGLSTGAEDRDEMGIVIEPLRELMGSSAPFEQFIFRTAAVREGKHDAKSAAGDLDLTLYSLRKWTYLALRGNPTVLLMLFVPYEACVRRTSLGAQLQELAPHFVSKDAGRAFLGYMTAQRQRLIGERGGKDVNRPDLVEKYGYDTKYAMHMLRLGFQGVELLTRGKMTLPMRAPERNYLSTVRSGGHDITQVLTRAGQLEAQLKALLSSEKIPEHADAEVVWNWVREQYLAHWKFEAPRWSVREGRMIDPAL